MVVSLKVEAFGTTDRGQVRDKNEDAYWLGNSFGLYAVADGLGGLPQGDIASQLALDTLASYMEKTYSKKLKLPSSPELDFPSLFSKLNQAVYQKGQELGTPVGIGTTLSLVHIVGQTLHLAHVGDSGVYLLKHKTLQKLTKDHTLAQNILDTLRPGEPTPQIPDYFHHTLTRCLGHPEGVQVDTLSLSLEGGERILLYTDGITKVFSEEDLAWRLHSASSPEIMVHSLMEEGNERGGPDNLTAIALFIET